MFSPVGVLWEQLLLKGFFQGAKPTSPSHYFGWDVPWWNQLQGDHQLQSSTNLSLSWCHFSPPCCSAPCGGLPAGWCVPGLIKMMNWEHWEHLHDWLEPFLEAERGTVSEGEESRSCRDDELDGDQIAKDPHLHQQRVRGVRGGWDEQWEGEGAAVRGFRWGRTGSELRGERHIAAPFVFAQQLWVMSSAIFLPIAPSVMLVLLRHSIAYFTWLGIDDNIKWWIPDIFTWPLMKKSGSRSRHSALSALPSPLLSICLAISKREASWRKSE